MTKPTEGELAKIKHNPIYLVLDNVLDTYNIGSLFRLADAIGAVELILCGRSETPPSSRIHKAAVGTEEWVKWSYAATATEAIKRLKREGVKIVVVEQDKRAIKLSSFNTSPPAPLLRNERGDGKISYAIVVGHETEGVSKDALDMPDVIVEIPMYGVNKSLNVHVSAAIVVYDLLAYI